MKKDNLYSTGQFMKLAHVTKKTLRYYDEHNILKPTYVTQTGARYYSDDDLAKMQQILLLKYLGFSLSDIREMAINDSDSHFMMNSLNLQLKLVEDRIEQLQVVAKSIQDTSKAISQNQEVNWSRMLSLISHMSMEQSLKTQYKNASNISSRINLHTLYSQNKQGWFPWIYEQCHITSGMNILEIGCGDGTFWTQNLSKLPSDVTITLSDLSEGMIRDVQRTISSNHFSFTSFDCEQIPFPDQTFDLVIANHVLFYCNHIENACKEIKRVLKPNGKLICSTYGQTHMQEVTWLVNEFDDRIVLSAQQLYKQFGRENGASVLQSFFSEIHWKSYEDSLLVPSAKPLISYVLSCHGNQNQYILDRYKDFCTFVKKKIGNGFYITKDAGLFIASK